MSNDVSTRERGVKRPIAHAAQHPDGSWREPHDLAEHLRGVAEMAAGFAAGFRSSDWARLAGLWHVGA